MVLAVPCQTNQFWGAMLDTPPSRGGMVSETHTLASSVLGTASSY